MYCYYFWVGFGGLGFHIVIISGLGFGGWGLGFGVWGLGFEVWGFGCGARPTPSQIQLECVSSLGFRVAAVERIWYLQDSPGQILAGFGFRVSGFGYSGFVLDYPGAGGEAGPIEESGLEFRVSGFRVSGFRVSGSGVGVELPGSQG